MITDKDRRGKKNKATVPKRKAELLAPWDAWSPVKFFEVKNMKSLVGAESSWKTFSRYVIPSVAAMLLFSLYTVVDGIFVARGVSADAMTSVNIALPFVNTLSGFSVLISMGTATLVAFARGRGDQKEANELFSQTVAVIVLVSVVVTGLVAVFSRQLAAWLGAGPQFIDDSADYLRIVSLFSVCFILSYCLEVMVKVDDKPVMAVVGVGASFLTNIGLDYLFIMRLGWGVKGAAWATGIAQLVSLVIFLGYFFSRASKLKLGRFRPRPRVLLRIFPLGVADCSVEMIVAFLTLIYNQVLLHTQGPEGQTVYAVVAYVNLFVFMVMQGVSQGMMHLVSLHVGRGEGKTAAGYFRMCLLTGLCVSVGFTLVCQIWPHVIAGLLLESAPELIGQAVTALRLFSLSFPFVGMNIAIAGYLTAWERPKPSISLALGRGFVFAPVALLLCAYLIGGTGIWLAALLGEVACFVVSLLVMRGQKDTLAVAAEGHA